MTDLFKKYKQKLEVFEAVELTEENIDEIKDEINVHGVFESWTNANRNILYIEIGESELRAKIGDMIIRGSEGTYYPCKKEIFDEKYEEIKDER